MQPSPNKQVGQSTAPSPGHDAWTLERFVNRAPVSMGHGLSRSVVRGPVVVAGIEQDAAPGATPAAHFLPHCEGGGGDAQREPRAAAPGCASARRSPSMRGNASEMVNRTSFLSTSLSTLPM